MHRLVLLFFGFWITALGLPASADPKVHQGLTTGDQVKGWQSVGRLMLGDHGFCTAVLIEPQLVLTAAHCLFDERSGERFADQSITFQAGWRHGRAEAYRGVLRAYPHPRYRYNGPSDLNSVQADLALLELEQPILLSQLAPYALGAAPGVGAQVSVVSYAQNRADAPSIERGCVVIAQQDKADVLSCDIDFGSSGAPVFRVENGEAQLVSLISAKAELGARKVSLAVPMQGLLPELQAYRAQESTLLKAGNAPNVRVISGGAAKAGARFITP